MHYADSIAITQFGVALHQINCLLVKWIDQDHTSFQKLKQYNFLLNLLIIINIELSTLHDFTHTRVQ